MAEVIHTRKGKYHYKYEHVREGDKVVSRYMYPVDGKGNKIKPYKDRVVQQIKVAQLKTCEDWDKYFIGKESEVEDLEKRYVKKLEQEDIRIHAAERHKKAEKIYRNSKSYNIEYGVKKDGILIKGGFKEIINARDYAGEHHYKTSTYDRKAIHLEHYSKSGYTIVITKKELKDKYKKEIDKLLGKKIK